MFEQLPVVAVVDEGLGHSSYVVGLGDGTALVVDPARFPDRQRAVAAERGWSLRWTADTHSHADYISGSPELAAAGATFLAPTAAGLEVPHRGVHGGEELALAGGVTLRALPTPGHTPEHLAYLLTVDGEPAALFSGGSLLVGAVGRTDLLGEDRRADLARQLHRALRRLVRELPPDLPVYPTHGAGSFCSAPTGADRTTTIGTELATNPLLAIEDEDRFVAAALDGLGSYPGYFRALPERNRRGPVVHADVPGLRPLAVDAVDERVADGAVVVDARPIAAFARGHVPGSLSIAHRPVFGSWLGWLVDLDRPIVVVADDTVDRRDLVRQALTVGHEAIAGELTGGVDAWRAAGRALVATPLVGPAAVTGQILDVRQRAEWVAGHVPGARHVELGSLTRQPCVAGDATVMCGHGERAMSGASVLERLGCRRVSVLAGGPAEWAAHTGRSLAVGP